MSLEENKTIVRRLYEAVNTQDLFSVEDFIAPHYVDHTRCLRGLEAFKQFGTMIFNAFPISKRKWRTSVPKAIRCGFAI